MSTKEIWKDIKGYGGLYQASNLGQIRSLDRITNNRFGQCLKKGKILNGRDSGGYYSVALYKNGKTKNYKVHKLIAMTFLNHNPCGMKEVIDHIDNNKLNNRLDNLQITDNRHNCSKDVKNKTSKYTGVCFVYSRSDWKAQITINGKNKHIGYYDNELDASKAYQDRLKEINN